MNPLPPHLMRPMERRAALCKILALGLVRLRMRDTARIADETGDFPLHFPADQSGHATTSKRSTA